MSQSNASESKNRRKEHLIIKFTDLADRDVQKNDLIDDSDYGSGTVYGEKDYLEQFEKSAFRYIYSQAFSQVHQIVMQSKNNNDSKGRQKKEIFDIDNTIAFTGRKGTGKTSAMLSFANFLDRHPLRLEDNGNETHDVKFVKICEIDVSYFRSNNDIFVQFLSEIADTLNQRIQEEKYNFNNSQLERTKMLREKVHKILSDYLSISENDSLKDYDSSYSFMKKIADRQKVEKEFANFMKEFQKWYLSDKQYYGEIYFIVCIDDVDMSSNPEEIVAAIHKYFMVPQLIVFMTAETDALTSEVQKQFYDRLCPIEDKVKQERMSMKQTRDYLSKILPTDNRITMPSWKKKEYMELFPYFVTFGKQDMLPVLKKQYPELVSKNSEFYRFLNLAEYEKKEFWRTPKEFIFMMIANRTKCYLSITGSKYHLMEPDSLRNMYILFYLLYGMHNIVEEYENRREEGNEYYIHRAENRKQLFDYIFFTKRKEMIFADGEEEFLDKLFIYPIERRGRMIWDQYYEKLNQKEHAERVKALYGEAFFDDQNARHQDEYYSYGELFRVMYVSTRCGIFTRDFIRFLLSAFSFILPPFVENEKIRNDERFSHDDFVKPRNHYEKMVEFYRYSFLGTWWNDLIGMDYDEGMYFRSNAEKMSKQLEEDVFSDCLRLNKSNFFTKSILKKIQEKTIIPFVLMALCMSKFQDYIEAKRIMICQNDSQQVLKYDRMEVKDVIFDMSHKFNMDYEELSDTNYDPESSYDPTAYFMNMMHLEEKNDHFIEFVFTYRFVRSMHRAFDCPINANNAIISKLKKIMEESEFGKFKEIVSSCLQQIINDFRDNHLSNVFKHTDLMYNVIKKHMIAGLYSSSTTPNAKKCIRQNSDWDGTKSIANAIRRVYHDLACEFEKQDEKYFSELKNPKDTDRHPCFSIRLKNSMIYKLFVEGGYDEAMEMGAYFIIEKRKKPNKVALFQQDPQMETLSNVLEKVYEPYTTYRRGITELKSLLNVSLSRYMDNYVTERVADAITLQIVSYSLAWQRVFDSMENNLNTEKQPRDSVAFEMMAMLENKAVRIAEAIKRMVLTGHVPGDDD